jgi:hypothetical protein
MNVYSYDRRVVRASVHEPLYGYTSMENSYLVDDYPYGRTLRCKIRYWLEKSPSKGFRFVSQTEDPRNGRWNNPKKSTYARFAANMYLDEHHHVVWRGLSEYDGGPAVADFVKAFPQSDYSLLKPFVIAKMKFLEAYASGKAKFTINGVPQETSEEDIGRTRKDLEAWAEAAKELHVHG